MIVDSIMLENYRNYKSLEISFDAGTNILYGDNAQGKTNVLEAIYVSSTTKSHRASKDREMISFDLDEAHIKTIFLKNDIRYRIDVHLRKSKAKGIAINGIPIKKASELFGIVNVVFFSPEDLNIIKDGPSQRRRFVDMELCQLDKIYVNNLINYNKTINQRNKLLKDMYQDNTLLSTLDIWDMQLEKYGIEVIKRRKQFVDELNEIIGDIHSKLTGGKETLTVIYEPSVAEDEFAKSLILNRDRDLKMKTTMQGPHRDDISFVIKGNDIRKYGSQGQQRTAALSLKLSEIELVKRITKDTPILLLDDVLSELDNNRQNYLLNSINNIQTIITCTGLDEFVNNRFNIDKIYKVVNGIINNEN